MSFSMSTMDVAPAEMASSLDPGASSGLLPRTSARISPSIVFVTVSGAGDIDSADSIRLSRLTLDKTWIWLSVFRRIRHTVARSIGSLTHHSKSSVNHPRCGDYWFLRTRCPACRTTGDVDLRAFDWHRGPLPRRCRADPADRMRRLLNWCVYGRPPSRDLVKMRGSRLTGQTRGVLNKCFNGKRKVELRCQVLNL